MANLNQVINAVAYQGNASFADLIEEALNDSTIHTIYVDQSIGTDSGTGSIVKPCKDLRNATPLLKEGTKLIIAPGNYDIPINIANIVSFIATADREVCLNKKTKLNGQLILNSQSKKCYFKNIAFNNNQSGSNNNQPIVVFNGYQGGVIFEGCEFESTSGKPVITFQAGDSCDVIFKDCKFNKESTITQVGVGNGATVKLVNTTTPKIELLQDGYTFTIEGCDCSKYTHAKGSLVVSNSVFTGFTDGEVCITSTAAKGASNSILLYGINTQNSTQKEAFGKISKTGDCQGWYCNITKPTTFEHDLGDLVNIGQVAQAVNQQASVSITTGSVGQAGGQKGITVNDTAGSFTISLLPADEANPGIVTQADQSFGGIKDFKGGLKISNVRSRNDTGVPVPLLIDENSVVISGGRELVETGTTLKTEMTMGGKRVQSFFLSVDIPKQGQTFKDVQISTKDVQFIELRGLVNVVDAANPFAKITKTKTMEEARLDGITFYLQSASSGAKASITNGANNKSYDTAKYIFTVYYLEK